MPFDLIKQVINDVARWEKPLDEIVPVNYGEFFLRKDWFDILTLIAQKLPATEITLATNGALVSESVVFKLCSIPNFRVINFSVNGYFAETYEKFMGLKADTIKGIRKAIAQFKVLRPDIRLKASMVFDPMYQSDLERDFFEQYWAGAVSWNPMLNKPDVWAIAAASCGRGTPIKIPRVLPCRSIFSDFVIGYDGKLSSCCFDAGMVLDLGNYSGDTRKDWDNGKLTDLRRLHNENRREEIPLCRDCSFA